MSKTWNETCPHCHERITNLYEYFCSNDYRQEFEFRCPSCKKEILAVVHTVPEFELSTVKKPKKGKK